MGSPTCVVSIPLTPRPHNQQRHSSYGPSQGLSSRRSPRKYSQYPVSSPGVTTTASAVLTRPELHRSATLGTSPRASALLSKVVSAPVSRRSSPTASVITTPINEKGVLHFHESRPMSQSGEMSPQLEEVMRYWQRNEQRDGYISFPDFENFLQEDQEEINNNNLQQSSKT